MLLLLSDYWIIFYLLSSSEGFSIQIQCMLWFIQPDQLLCSLFLINTTGSFCSRKDFIDSFSCTYCSDLWIAFNLYKHFEMWFSVEGPSPKLFCDFALMKNVTRTVTNIFLKDLFLSWFRRDNFFTVESNIMDRWLIYYPWIKNGLIHLFLANSYTILPKVLVTPF